MRQVFVLGLVVVLLAVACGGSQSSQTTGTPRLLEAFATLPTQLQVSLATLSAELRITPTPTATPLVASADVRLCRRSDITTAVRSSAATGGELMAAILIANRSNTPCQISRLPDVQLLDSQGEVLPIALLPGQPCQVALSFYCIFEQPILLLPNRKLDPRSEVRSGQAMLMLSWHIHNGAGICPTPPPEADVVTLLLPGEGSVLTVDVMGAISYGGAPPRYGIRPCNRTVQTDGYIPGTAP